MAPAFIDETVERRATPRYPIKGPVTYWLIHRRSARSGVGQGINLSSTGLLLETEDVVEEGVKVEASIPWFPRPENGIALKLHVIGRVVRSGNRRMAIRIERYQFARVSSMAEAYA